MLSGVLSSGMLVACSGSETQSEQVKQGQAQQLPDLYIRGDFNSWGTSAPLIKISDNKYRVTADISLGIHGFKFASQDWEYQLMLAENDGRVLDLNEDLDTPIVLVNKKTDAQNRLIAERPGIYIFVIEKTAKGLELTVERQVSNQIAETAPHPKSAEKTQLSFDTYDGGSEQVTFSIKGEANGLRTYVHSTTQVLRDPVPQFSVYSEDPSLPRLRSGDTAFDALFALSVDEMKLDSVSNIQDGSYNSGQAIACDCFETGEKWNYVWTRDLSYAAHLSLGLLDPQRVKNSLDFKLSGYRDGIEKPEYAAGTADGLQIIQDTGSGGSWPISTDRITWAFGAEAALNSLSGEERTEFAKRALTALSNTIENDRLVAFDSQFGVYNGEQSFLDWREQTYANWLPDDLSSMATAKAISTNAGHYQAIRLAERLANELGKNQLAARYQNWGDALKQAINQHLWLEGAGLYSSLTAAHFDNSVMHKFDWLGQSLAIITGIASESQAKQILANYPHGPMGAPVIFPQQPGIPVYHNRAIWPFVTAYGLKAAKQGNNVAVANEAYSTLIRGAALNLSNMENLEWLSAQPIWLEKDNPQLSGPVINSKRQLWSVAAYLNMVIDGIFGVQAKPQGLELDPYVTTELRERYFAGQSSISLQNLSWKGKQLDIELSFPDKTDSQGVYTVKQINLNGQALDSNLISEKTLTQSNQIEIVFSGVESANTQITYVAPKTGGYDETAFAPREPKLDLMLESDTVTLSITDEYNTGDVTYQIYRNGTKVAQDLTNLSWQDPKPLDRQACYAVSAVFTASGNASHHSQVVCANPGQFIAVDDSRVETNLAVKTAQKDIVIPDWGDKSDRFVVKDLKVEQAGRYAIQLKYTNWLHQINTGITCGVKWMVVKDEQGKIVKQGAVQLPHTKQENGAGFSTPVNLDLARGSYQISLHDYFNMSYLTNNQTYSSAGGETGALNQFSLFGVRIMPLE